MVWLCEYITFPWHRLLGVKCYWCINLCDFHSQQDSISMCKPKYQQIICFCREIIRKHNKSTSFLTNISKISKPGPEVIKLFLCSIQLSMNFFLLINVKMPTIVGILTFMSGKNSILGLSEPKKNWISWYFYTYEHLKFHAQVSWPWKKFYDLGARTVWTVKLDAIIAFKVVVLCFQLPADDDDDDIGMTPWADRQTDKKLANVKLRQSAIDITAEDLIPRLNHNNVADLVLISMVILHVL